MEEKLQVLLDRIREEGVEQARRKADQLVQEAQAKADETVATAEQKAAKIMEDARAEADAHRRNVEAELKLSIQQATDALKQEITSLVTTKAVDAPLKSAFQDGDFLKNFILQLVQKWSPEEGLALQLPADRQQALIEFFEQQTHDTLGQELMVQPVASMRDGFRLGPADGSYVLSFTSDDFAAFFAEYLRPQTKKILFEK